MSIAWLSGLIILVILIIMLIAGAPIAISLAVTGGIDMVADENRVYAIRNGHKMMSLVTGAGCQLSALTSAYVAADKEDILESVCAAVSVMGISGELAYRRMAEVDGNASYRNYIIDAVYNMTDETLKELGRIERI